MFSTGCFRHCVTDSAAFWNVYVEFTPRTGTKPLPNLPGDPVSLKTAMDAWRALPDLRPERPTFEPGK